MPYWEQDWFKNPPEDAVLFVYGADGMPELAVNHHDYLVVRELVRGAGVPEHLVHEVVPRVARAELGEDEDDFGTKRRLLRATNYDILADGRGGIKTIVQVKLPADDRGIHRFRVCALHLNFGGCGVRPEYGSVAPAIGRLKHLRVLCLDLPFVSLPETIGELSRLEYLSVNCCIMPDLPASLGHLKNLALLKLEDVHNRHVATMLPEEFCHLPKLTHLCLDSVSAELFPPIHHLPRLQSLFLFEPNFSVLPEAVCALTKLRALHIGSMDLEVLPEAIGRLKDLTTLRLHGPKIATLPSSVGHLVQLRVVDLSFSRVQSLPDSIDKLTALERLNLDHTGFQTHAQEDGLVELATRLPRLDFLGAQLEGRPRVAWALATKRAHHRLPPSQPFPTALWPELLSRADRAFAPYPSSCPHRRTAAAPVASAVHQLLRDHQEAFLGALLHHRGVIDSRKRKRFVDAPRWV